MLDTMDELNEIGAVLVAAGSGEPVKLTDEQRIVLASAPTADVLFAVAHHTSDLWRIPKKKRPRDPAIALNSLRTINQRLAPIAAAWANECRAAFGDPLTKRRITAALASDEPLDRIADFIQEDHRLASYERNALLSILEGANSKRQAMHETTAAAETAYISQISVAGFRGIGPRSELNVGPHPGLTIVYGANGSGKSSFAEALDVLLTGTTGRFAGRGVEWRSAQANAHRPESGYVSGKFALRGHETDIEPFVRSWTGDGYLTGAYDKTPIEKMQAIGWLDALNEFKPVLGYAELGPLLDEDAFGEATDSAFAGQQETVLARHIRLRTGISDPLISSIQEAVQSNGATIGEPFLQELSAWYWLSLSRNVVGGRRFATNRGLPVNVTKRLRNALDALAPLSGQSLLHPRELNWNAFFDSAGKATVSGMRRYRRSGRDGVSPFVGDMLNPLFLTYVATSSPTNFDQLLHSQHR